MDWLDRAGAVAAAVVLFLLLLWALVSLVSAGLDDFAEDTCPFGKD